MPITDLVRMRALEGGIQEPNTYRRMELAVQAGTMNENDASSLRDALILIAAQRAYEMNARVIETSDEMLATNANLRR